VRHGAKAVGLVVRFGLPAGLLVALGLLAIGTQVAQAAFPGANGRIGFTLQKYIMVQRGPGSGESSPELVWSQIETVLPSGRGLRPLRPCPSGGCFDSNAVWSPDGKRLALFTAAGLAVIDQNGKRLAPIRITSTIGPVQAEPGAILDQHAVTWSPNGRQLLFVGGRTPDLIPHLFAVAINGTGLRQITSTCTDEPTWSVTGTIAFRAACQRSGIWTMTLNGSRLQRVLYNPYWAPAYPDWSPDGTQLTYAGSANYNYADVFVCDANGSAVRRLTRTGGTQPTWSPDGKYIAFIRDNALYVTQRDGRRPRRVVLAPPPTSTEHFVLSSPSWQPISR
jgi:Tol biopolymer transport system component